MYLSNDDARANQVARSLMTIVLVSAKRGEESAVHQAQWLTFSIEGVELLWDPVNLSGPIHKYLVELTDDALMGNRSDFFYLPGLLKLSARLLLEDLEGAFSVIKGVCPSSCFLLIMQDRPHIRGN